MEVKVVKLVLSSFMYSIKGKTVIFFYSQNCVRTMSASQMILNLQEITISIFNIYPTDNKDMDWIPKR